MSIIHCPEEKRVLMCSLTTLLPLAVLFGAITWTTLSPTRHSLAIPPVYLNLYLLLKTNMGWLVPLPILYQEELLLPRIFHGLDRKSTRLNSSHQIISYA